MGDAIVRLKICIWVDEMHALDTGLFLDLSNRRIRYTFILKQGWGRIFPLDICLFHLVTNTSIRQQFILFGK